MAGKYGGVKRSSGGKGSTKGPDLRGEGGQVKGPKTCTMGTGMTPGRMKGMHGPDLSGGGHTKMMGGK